MLYEAGWRLSKKCQVVYVVDTHQVWKLEQSESCWFDEKLNQMCLNVNMMCLNVNMIDLPADRGVCWVGYVEHSFE